MPLQPSCIILLCLRSGLIFVVCDPPLLLSHQCSASAPPLRKIVIRRTSSGVALIVFLPYTSRNTWYRFPMLSPLSPFEVSPPTPIELLRSPRLLPEMGGESSLHAHTYPLTPGSRHLTPTPPRFGGYRKRTFKQSSDDVDKLELRPELAGVLVKRAVVSPSSPCAQFPALLSLHFSRVVIHFPPPSSFLFTLFALYISGRCSPPNRSAEAGRRWHLSTNPLRYTVARS